MGPMGKDALCVWKGKFKDKCGREQNANKVYAKEYIKVDALDVPEGAELPPRSRGKPVTNVVRSTGCKNGHVACSQCSSKPNKKCSECCRALECCPLMESILKSITGSCQFVRFGCKETISYAQKHTHEESCPYGLCSCSMPECDFQSPVQALSAHFRSQHPKYLVESDTDKLRFNVHLNQKQRFCALLSEDECFFLLLNRRAPSRNSLSVVCIGPAGSMGEHVEYSLAVVSGKTTLYVEAPLINTREWKGIYPEVDFLFVPAQLCNPSCKIGIVVFIAKGN